MLMLLLILLFAPILPPSVSINASQSVARPGETYTYTVTGDWLGDFTFAFLPGEQVRVVEVPDGCGPTSPYACTLTGDGAEHSYVFTVQARIDATPGCIPVSLLAHSAHDAYQYFGACVWHHDDHRIFLPLIAVH